jgi:hypothetical protein
MLPVPVSPHWYQAYWMTERPPHHRRLIAVLRWLRRWLTASHAARTFVSNRTCND